MKHLRVCAPSLEKLKVRLATWSLPLAKDWNEMSFQPKPSCDFVIFINLG